MSIFTDTDLVGSASACPIAQRLPNPPTAAMLTSGALAALSPWHGAKEEVEVSGKRSQGTALGPFFSPLSTVTWSDFLSVFCAGFRGN